MWYVTCECDVSHMIHDMWLVTNDLFFVNFFTKSARTDTEKQNKNSQIAQKFKKVAKRQHFIVLVLLTALVERVRVSCGIHRVAMSVCVFVCAISKHPLPEVVETSAELWSKNVILILGCDDRVSAHTNLCLFWIHKTYFFLDLGSPKTNLVFTPSSLLNLCST